MFYPRAEQSFVIRNFWKFSVEFHLLTRYWSDPVNFEGQLYSVYKSTGTNKLAAADENHSDIDRNASKTTSCWFCSNRYTKKKKNSESKTYVHKYNQLLK